MVKKPLFHWELEWNPVRTFTKLRVFMATNGISTTSQPIIPVFDGNKYEFWSIKMKTLFKSQELWEFVEDGNDDKDKDEQNLKENKKKDAKALFFLQQAVSDSLFSRIASATSSKEAWQTLKTEFQGSAKGSR